MPSVTYCTVADVRANTNSSDLANASIVDDTAMTNKILIAEQYIDSLSKYWNREGGTQQARVYPRLEDTQYSGASGHIPDAVKYATIAQVEFMYVNMPDRDHGIIGDEKPTAESISPRARQLMNGGYIRRTGRILLQEAQKPGTL